MNQLLPRLPSTEHRGAGQTDRPSQVRVRLAWLLVFRAVVVSVLLVTVVVLKATATEELLFARASLVMYGIAGAAYLTILLGAIWLRVLGERHIVFLAYGQLVADAAVASALVMLTGGVESIFVFLYSLSVLNAAIVLERRGAIVIAASASTLYAAVWVVSAPSASVLWALLPQFLTNTGSFFLVAALGGYLTGQLSRTSERLKDTEASLAQLERLNAAVLGSLPSGVLSIDSRGRVGFINQAGSDILGGRAEVGVDLRGLLPELVGTDGAEAAARFEVTLSGAGRRTRIIGGNAAPLVGVEGAGRVVVFQDLTELRSLQDEVTRAERLAALGRVAAGLAHEIRNPLAAMIGCLHLLRSDDSRIDPDNRRMLDIVWREAERLSALVQGFLKYARPVPARPAAVSLRTLLEETASTVRHGLKVVTVRIGQVDDLVVYVDADQLRQVFWNLIMNSDAVMADAGRAEGVVLISGYADGDVAHVDVDDNGPGVPEDARSRLFEPFFTTRPDGNGLGLATSRQLMVQNGGGIAVGVAPAGGARFSVTIPLDGAALDPEQRKA